MQGKINADKRSAHGKSGLKAMRVEGFVPAVIYGKGMDSVDIKLPVNPLMKAIHQTGKVMEVEVTGGNSYLCTVDEIQRDPVSLKPIHASFHKLERGQKTIVNLPIVLENEGKCAGAKEGGIVILSQQSIDVEGLPSAMPEAVHVDVHALGLTLNHSLHITDLVAPEGCSFLDKDKDLVVASCALPRAEKEPETTEEVISIEGAAPEGTPEGDAPAAEAGDEQKKAS